MTNNSITDYLRKALRLMPWHHVFHFTSCRLKQCPARLGGSLKTTAQTDNREEKRQLVSIPNESMSNSRWRSLMLRISLLESLSMSSWGISTSFTQKRDKRQKVIIIFSITLSQIPPLKMDNVKGMFQRSSQWLGESEVAVGHILMQHCTCFKYLQVFSVWKYKPNVNRQLVLWL